MRQIQKLQRALEILREEDLRLAYNYFLDHPDSDAVHFYASTLRLAGRPLAPAGRTRRRPLRAPRGPGLPVGPWALLDPIGALLMRK